jgi:hypothetical protein
MRAISALPAIWPSQHVCVDSFFQCCKIHVGPDVNHANDALGLLVVRVLQGLDTYSVYSVYVQQFNLCHNSYLV